jgi:IS5 family transposase
MKMLKELELQFENPQWAYDAEPALIDAILERNPGLYETMSGDILKVGKNNELGRGDGPGVEQIVRAALYKEMKGLNYQQLEYAQHDSKICPLFMKLGGREPFAYETLHKYIGAIQPDSLKQLLVRINQIALKEGLEDGGGVREDSTVVESNIHYPTNNSLVWDCIRVSQRILKELQQIDTSLPGGGSLKEAKRNYYEINVSRSEEKRGELFEKQLPILKRQMRRSVEVLKRLAGKKEPAQGKGLKLRQRLEALLPQMEKVYSMAERKELRGEKVPNGDKLFSIFEEHTDIIVKGAREVQFGHKVDLAIGRKGMILVCNLVEGNPADKSLYPAVLKQLKENYQVVPRDLVTDGGYACMSNLELAKQQGVVNIVFNKVVGSLRNVASSVRMEKRLKKWRSGIEAVISNLKRGFDLFRCEWKGRSRFEAKVLWSVLAYNFKVMTRTFLERIAKQTA